MKKLLDTFYDMSCHIDTKPKKLICPPPIIFHSHLLFCLVIYEARSDGFHVVIFFLLLLFGARSSFSRDSSFLWFLSQFSFFFSNDDVAH